MATKAKKALAQFLGAPDAGQPLLAEPFRDLERTHEMGIELVHRTLAQVHAASKVGGGVISTESSAKILKTLMDILVVGMKLEIERMTVKARLGADKESK